jgi:hypothetical protein
MHRFTRPASAIVALCINLFVGSNVLARDDGRYANSPLKFWFDQLASGKGFCCSFADAPVCLMLTGTHRTAVIAFGSVANGYSYLTQQSCLSRTALAWPWCGVYGRGRGNKDPLLHARRGSVAMNVYAPELLAA